MNVGKLQEVVKVKKLLCSLVLVLAVRVGGYCVDFTAATVWQSSFTVSTGSLSNQIISSGTTVLHTIVFPFAINGCFVDLLNSQSLTLTDEIELSRRRVYSTSTVLPVWDIVFSSGMVWSKSGSCPAEVLFRNYLR